MQFLYNYFSHRAACICTWRLITKETLLYIHPRYSSKYLSNVASWSHGEKYILFCLACFIWNVLRIRFAIGTIISSYVVAITLDPTRDGVFTVQFHRRLLFTYITPTRALLSNYDGKFRGGSRISVLAYCLAGTGGVVFLFRLSKNRKNLKDLRIIFFQSAVLFPYFSVPFFLIAAFKFYITRNLLLGEVRYNNHQSPVTQISHKISLIHLLNSTLQSSGMYRQRDRILQDSFRNVFPLSRSF